MSLETMPTNPWLRSLVLVLTLGGWASTAVAAPQVEVRSPPPRIEVPAERRAPAVRAQLPELGRTPRPVPSRATPEPPRPAVPTRPAEGRKVDTPRDRETRAAQQPEVAPARDWGHAPAIVEHAPASVVYAVSDLHGRYEEAFRLFEGNRLLSGVPSDPGGVKWTGGTATVVVVGDIINKGNGSTKIIDLLRVLQSDAAAKGGKVIVTMGNHEASFIHEPLSSRSLRDGTDGKYGFGHELYAMGESPYAVARGNDSEGRGRWLRDLPFAARVGDYFFIHSGNTRGLSRDGLAHAIEGAVASGGFGHTDVIGDHPRSVLGADDWKLTAAEARTNADRLGVKHIVMGHIPSALGADGEIARSRDGALIKLDTGLGNGDAQARLLRIGSGGGVQQLDESGAREKVRRRGRLAFPPTPREQCHGTPRTRGRDATRECREDAGREEQRLLSLPSALSCLVSSKKCFGGSPLADLPWRISLGCRPSSGLGRDHL